MIILGHKNTNNKIKNGFYWIDSNSDNIPDNWAKSGLSLSFVTGNGFNGTALRMDGVVNNKFYYTGYALKLGKSYKLRFKYRSDGSVFLSRRIYGDSGGSYQIDTNIPINTGDAIYYEKEFVAGGNGNLTFYFGDAGYWEIDEVYLIEL